MPTTETHKDNYTIPIIHIHPPSYLYDYVCNSSTSHQDTSPLGTPYPIYSFHYFDHFSPSQNKFSLSITKSIEPRTYKEACQHDCWVKEMHIELDALVANNTWQLVEKPPYVKPIGSRWVYKVKHRADGSIERYKAKSVAKGYNQIEGLDFFDIFSPVEKLTTVRTLIALASLKQWCINEMDVNNALLHGDLKNIFTCPFLMGLWLNKVKFANFKRFCMTLNKQAENGTKH